MKITDPRVQLTLYIMVVALVAFSFGGAAVLFVDKPMLSVANWMNLVGSAGALAAALLVAIYTTWKSRA